MKARKIRFLKLYTVAKYKNMSKMKGMGIKRDASVNKTKPEKELMFLCPLLRLKLREKILLRAGIKEFVFRNQSCGLQSLG